MSPPKYCPPGSPSLLNGDFYENLARLTDFSWSAIFSSPPLPSPPPTVQVNVTSKPTGIRVMVPATKLAAIIDKVQGAEDNKIEAALCALLILYSILLFFIGKKLASRIKFTRQTAIRFQRLSGIVFALLIASILLSRIFPTLHPMGLSSLVFGNLLLLGCCAFVKDLHTLKVSDEDEFKYRNKTLKCVFIISAVLLFFFAPVHRPIDCQELAVRLFSEGVFYAALEYLWILYCIVDRGMLLASAECLYIYKNGKAVRRCVNKEAFGWIELNLKCDDV